MQHRFIPGPLVPVKLGSITGSRNIPPLIDSLITVLTRRNTFGKKIFYILYSRLSKTIALGVVRRGNFMFNVMGNAPLFEVSTELRPPVRSDGRWPAKKVEPGLKVTGDGFGC